MKRLQKLSRIQKFFKNMSFPDFPGVSPVLVVSAGDAVKRLGAGVAGKQVLVAYPEAHQYYDGDAHTETIDTAVFVLEKDAEAARTLASEEAQYDRLLDLADYIVALVHDAISGTGCPACDCPELSGLELSSVDIVPELSIFGGWNGYSVEFSFR